MTPQSPPPRSVAPSLLVAQGRIVDAVADGVVLFGTSRELAKRLGVSATAFRQALAELAEAGWIIHRSDPDGRLSVRWERRSRRMPVEVERRRADSAW